VSGDDQKVGGIFKDSKVEVKISKEKKAVTYIYILFN
jgi:hypothetical protein